MTENQARRLPLARGGRAASSPRERSIEFQYAAAAEIRYVKISLGVDGDRVWLVQVGGIEGAARDRREVRLSDYQVGLRAIGERGRIVPTQHAILVGDGDVNPAGRRAVIDRDALGILKKDLIGRAATTVVVDEIHFA